jgi:hypothetical protein
MEAIRVGIGSGGRQAMGTSVLSVFGRGIHEPLTPFGCSAIRMSDEIGAVGHMDLQAAVFKLSVQDVLVCVASKPSCWLPEAVEHFVNYTPLPSAWFVPPLLARWNLSSPTWSLGCLKWALSLALDSAGGAMVAVVPPPVTPAALVSEGDVPDATGCGTSAQLASSLEAALGSLGIQLPTARLPLGPKRLGKHLVVRVPLALATLPWQTLWWLKLGMADDGGTNAMLEILLRRMQYLCDQAYEVATALGCARTRAALWDAFHDWSDPVSADVLWDWICGSGTGPTGSPLDRNLYLGLSTIFALLPLRVRCAVLDVCKDGCTALTRMPWLVLSQEQAVPGSFCLWSNGPVKEGNQAWICMWAASLLPALVTALCHCGVPVPQDRIEESLAQAKAAHLTSTQLLVDALVRCHESPDAYGCAGIYLGMPRLQALMPQPSLARWRWTLRFVLRQYRPTEPGLMDLDDRRPLPRLWYVNTLGKDRAMEDVAQAELKPRLMKQRQ